MVRNSGTTADTRRIRRLKTPLALEVEASNEGVPLRLKLGGAWQDVTLVRRPWRIDQQWWRGVPVRRDYSRVAPEDGPALTLYRDAASGEWFRQEYDK
jgi:hypothetical protein